VAALSVASSLGAPVLLIGGWTVAAGRQVGGFDPVSRSISALAAFGADDRWIMTTALAGVGVCHLVTASGLRAAATAGRSLLALGGVATVLVAVFPLGPGGAPGVHAAVAGVAFAALAVWPAASWSRGSGRPWPLRPPGAFGACVVLLAAVGWFAAELGGGIHLGSAERWAAGAQAVWPLVVAGSCRSGRPWKARLPVLSDSPPSMDRGPRAVAPPQLNASGSNGRSNQQIDPERTAGG
jgi:hypothetical membrane protein